MRVEPGQGADRTQPATPAVDVDAYCARIGHDGPLGADLETLRALQERQAAAIAFEAIDVLLGRGVELAPVAVDRKLIVSRRGGYCFEQNGLLMRVLRAIGFSVDALLARVCYGLPPDSPPRPTNHMALRVTLDGADWLVDSGFGGLVPTFPLRLDTREAQATRHEPFRLTPLGNSLLLEARCASEWLALYELLPEPRVHADFELANWYTSTHPSSRFRRNLVVARTTPQARYALLDNRLTIRRGGGEVERRLLDAQGIEDALVEVFALPTTPEWRTVIERAAAAPARSDD